MKFKEFKIGDKVRWILSDEPMMGYVSGVFLGNLFLLEDPEIDVHIGNGQHVKVLASELEHCKD